MNQDRYQLVFSRARGCLVAVGEGARRVGKYASGQRTRATQATQAIRSPWSPLAAGTAIALAAGLLGTAQAQLVADPAAPGPQRATVLAASNGMPLVNITTPSASGVSRNTWRQFDVGAPGAILNNSRTDTSTQLGGWVQGNPWLAGGSARVILNEVNSAHPSQLKGWVEVAGQRAEVVIANPAGIQVNGAGFINASGVALTTGTPVFNGGALDAYRVQGGQVTIEGAGLDARGADATAILARAVQVNAGLWAQRLTVVTGANTVAASGHAVLAGAIPTGDAPAFALDVAQIGGMYAGHIHLVGTEAGLGVNNSGLIAADTGQLTLDVTGQLTNHGALLAAGDMDLRADRVLNEGTADAPAVIGAGGALDLEALHITNRGTLQARSLHARVDTLHNRSGGALMADRVTIEAHEISNRPDTNAVLAQAGAPVIAAHDDLQLGVHTLHNEDGALLHSEGDIGIGGSLDADGNALGQADTVNNVSATIEAMGGITLWARTLTNERRNVEVTQTTVIDRSAELDMPSWWVNGPNKHGAPIAFTSNHDPYRYYLLDPASILSEELLITPDGNRVRRVEVALDPSDSIHYAASGAYGGQYGVQSRLSVGAPTTAVLYVQQRLDGVTNPDQVTPDPMSGSADVFAAHTSKVHTWQQDTLSYSSAYGRCSTDCTLLVVQPGFNNPLADLLRSDQAHLVNDHPGLEVSRSARHTAVEDRLNADAGASAAIRAGAGMTLAIGEALINRHADILAGGALHLIAPEASVHNEGHTLKRTHHFAITSHTAGLGSFDWTKPDITETLGELGGRITAAQGLHIQALDLTNTEQARASGLTSSGLTFVGVSLPGDGTPLVVADNSLFKPAPANQNFLIETDPRFANQRQWLGSDYLFEQLAHDPATALKRLGDGFYEQKLIREQVAELTGRRRLHGFSNDEAQFLALMDAGLAYAQALELKPGIALSAEQVAQLTTDLVWLIEREVVLPDGTRTTALVPQVYLRAVPGDALQPSGALIGGQDVRLDIGRDLVNHGGRIEGDTLLAQAGRDLSNIGGLLQARSELLANAGRHVTIASPTHTTTFAGAHATQSRTELAGVGAVRITGDASGAKLTIEAGEDVRLQGAAVSNASAGASTILEAGRNVQLQTVAVGGTNSVVADARNFRHHSERQDIGSEIAALGAITLSAGNDLTARAASVQAGGELQVQAGQDIKLEAGRAQSESESSLYRKRSGLLSKKSTEERESAASDVAIGSSFGGANVVMEAGRDIQVKGSAVDAQHLLLLGAGRDVEIASEVNRESGAYFQETKKSGLSVSRQGIALGKSAQSSNGSFSNTTQAASSVSGGDVLIVSGRDTAVRASTVVADELLSIDAGGEVNITSGVNREASGQHSHSKSKGISLLPLPSKDNLGITLLHDNKHSGNGSSATTTAAASTVGSLGGDVAISARQRYQQSGSDVLALAGNVDIDAQHIAITEARETRSAHEQHSSKSTVLGATPRNALVDAIKGARTTLDTAQATGETGNARVQALGAAATALNAASTATQVADLMASPEKIASVTIDFNLGTSKSRSESTETAEAGRASTVAAGGDVRLQARGAGKDSDLLVRGSEVSAGQDALLKAEGDVQLESAQDRSTLHSQSKNSGASVGVGISFGASNGITFNASANKGKGNADGQDITQRNTHIVAGNAARIESGTDTTLAGAVVSAETVQAEVGGDLNIQSRQDESRFNSDQTSSGWGVSLCIPPFCYGASSVSASSGAQNIESEFASVNEQSGLKAGDGGFQVNVQGDTTLQGGAITSTDKAVEENKNRFDTGGELKLSDAENHARYEAEGYQLSAAAAIKGAEPTTPAQKQLAPATPAKTEGGAGIGQDSGEARSITKAAISGIAGEKDARTGDQERGIAPIFDQRRVQTEIDAQIQITAEFGKGAATAWGRYANRQFTDAVAEGDEETARCWAPDGACRAGGHAVIGGLAGGTAGAVGAGASSLTAPAFLSLLTDIGVPPGMAEGLTTAYAAGMGAVTGGAAGSAGALNEAANNNAQAARLILGTVETAGTWAAQRCLQSPACVEAVGSAGVLILNGMVTAANGSGEDGPSLGDVNPHVFGGDESGLPADTFGTPPGGPQDDEDVKPTRITNPKHHQNSSSPEPKNVENLYQHSITDKNGVRWAKDANGVIHRFSRPSNGETHWNGSTAGIDPIKTQNIPIEIRRLFGVK